MIKAIAFSQRGPIALIGITDGNIDRLKEGRPLEIDIDAWAGTGVRLSLVVVSYQPTHVDIVAEWKAAGLPVGPELMEQAAKIDATA